MSKKPVPGTPWGIEADMFVKESGCDPECARDYVILGWLMRGDTRALGALLELGRAPGPAVLKFLARMLQHESLDDKKDKREVPYRLVVKSRTGKKGRPEDPEIRVRDRLYADNVRKMMISGTTNEHAIANVAAMVEDDGEERVSSTVKKAYERRWGRTARDKEKE